jgi:hypothetical protein
MTRNEMYDDIEHLTVVLKFSAEDTADLIKEATGIGVNVDADDLLETLNDAQLQAVCQRFSEVEQEYIRRNAKLKLNVENERDRALLIRVLENTDLVYNAKGPIVAIQTDVPEAPLKTLEEMMGPLTRLPD